MRKIIGLGLFGIFFLSTTQAATPGGRAEFDRHKPLSGTRATYCHAPRDAQQRVDVSRLMRELEDLHANTYSFCIHNFATDWDDLHRILPAAARHHIRIWASLVPPSESPPRTKNYPEPFRLDYQRWAEEFARLSLREPSLVAWSIDDFTHNLKFYTTNYVDEMLARSRAINPRLAFVPCCYFPALTQGFAERYGKRLDGVLFPYRHESAGANLKDPSLVTAEIGQIKKRFGQNFPVILDIYATAHSKLGATTPNYVEEAMKQGLASADGVMIYCHQDPRKDLEKWAVIKQEFGAAQAVHPRLSSPKDLSR